MMTVAGLSTVVHNDKPPHVGAAVLEAPLGGVRGTRLWQDRVSHKIPEGATGEFVPMTKRITSGIEASPMVRRAADRVAFRVTQPGIRYTPNNPKALTADLGGKGEAPPVVNVPWWKRHADLTGIKFGQLVVVRYLGDRVDKDGNSVHSRWLVRCSCGEYENRRGDSLRRLTSSVSVWADRCFECQNLRKLRGGNPKQTDIWQDTPIPTLPVPATALGAFAGGERFGHLTVIGYGKSGQKGGRWVVRCDCGLYGVVSARGLKNGKPPQQCTTCYYARLAADGEVLS